MKDWKTEHCAEQPNELQEIGKDIYMQRRNIREVHHEADTEAGTEEYTDYECECREINASEYNMLKAIEEIDTQGAIDAYTLQLIEQGLL